MMTESRGENLAIMFVSRLPRACTKCVSLEKRLEESVRIFKLHLIILLNTIFEYRMVIQNLLSNIHGDRCIQMTKKAFQNTIDNFSF